MYVLIILFAVSLIAMISILSLKSWEIGKGKASTIARFAPGGEEAFEAYCKRVAGNADQMMRNGAYVCAGYVKTSSHKLLTATVRHGVHHSKKLKKAIEGRNGVLKKNGAASFYLKSIKNETNGIRKNGNIEEE